MSKFWIVALETLKRNVKTSSFLVMLLSPLLIIALAVGGGYFGSQLDQTGEVALISNNEALATTLSQAVDLDIDTSVKSQEQAETALKKEQIDGILTVNLDEATGEITANFQTVSSLGSTEKLQLNQVLSQVQMNATAEVLSLSPEQVQRLLTPANLTEQLVEITDNKIVDKTDDNQMIKTMVSLFVSIAMFMIITLYTQIVAQEVASEKGTRIMEVILSSTSAATHFYGKMMGIFLVILLQVLSYGVMVLVAWPFAMRIDLVKELLAGVDLSGLSIDIIVVNVLFLVLGVVLYAIAAAFCGSLVSKSEDASKAVVPVSYFSMAGYFLTIFLGMNSPENPLFKICSFIPFLSSYIMPQRMAIGQVSSFEIVVSLVLLALAVVVLLRISARLYQSTALVYSDENMFKVFKRSLHTLQLKK